MECIVCKNLNANIDAPGRLELRDVECPLCGWYRISHLAIDDQIIDDISLEDRILFSAYLRNHTSLNNPIKLLPSDIVRIPETVAQYKQLTAMDKVHSVICFLAEASSYIGAQVALDFSEDYTRFYCKNEIELGQIGNYLDQTGIIKVSSGQSNPI